MVPSQALLQGPTQPVQFNGREMVSMFLLLPSILAFEALHMLSLAYFSNFNSLYPLILNLLPIQIMFPDPAFWIQAPALKFSHIITQVGFLPQNKFLHLMPPSIHEQPSTEWTHVCSVPVLEMRVWMTSSSWPHGIYILVKETERTHK